MSRVLILGLARLNDDEGDFALPAEIKNELGSVLDRDMLSTKRLRTVLLPDEAHSTGASTGAGVSCVFVELTTRHGARISRRLPLIGRFTEHTIDLCPDDIPDWLTWAAADVDLAQHARISFSETSASHVWGRLWARRLSAWRPVNLTVDQEKSNDYAKQFELTTHEPSVLQIGGPDLPSRFVSLPEGRVKVLLTANAADRADGDPLNVVVSRLPTGPRNTLLSLLSMNQSVHAAGVAKELGDGFDWERVGDDPLSGCALGHAAIRLHALDRFTLADAGSLLQMARVSSDAAILLATRAIAEDASDVSRVIRLLDVGIGRGLPVLAQSLTAANVALDVLRRRANRVDQKVLAALTEKARNYSRANAGAGPFMSFYGWKPYVPHDQQATRRCERSSGGSVVNAIAAIASAFKPMPSTPLI
ncbi:hypothetical protein AWB74_06212 [Caballeronia arvi]|uniref:Uncharacterized protein n=1 Tax=Caballeronia arvi TaxID=1777135 RepID=A0A158KMG5_9BURK|nr:hypothetical protein [Caballeronia arvi]SAL82274.1 hypothetical protein AWB74_06212 [Caballeronia arvi]